MFGLAKHICCRINRVSRLIGNDENLTRTCEHIDIHMTIDLFFR